MDAMNFSGTLLEKIPRIPGTRSYRFSRPSEYRFEAGQYYNVTIPSPEGPLTHSFSHSDSPTEDFVELTTRLTGSAFKNALDALPLGTEVEFSGPWGRFVFRNDESKIAFLTGGVGITPVRSMLRYLADTGGQDRIAGQQIVLFYGSMTEDGVVYEDELKDLEQTIAGFRVVHVITNPTENWRGYRGFITADIIRGELSSPAAWTYYVVGPPPMIAAMQKILDELTIPETRVVVENFAGYAS